MAIVKMNKVSLIGLEAEKDQIIEKLMKLGVVEITNLEHITAGQEWAELVEKDGDEAEVANLDADIARVEAAIGYLSLYDTRKKGLFEPKRTISYEQYSRIVGDSDKVWKVVEKIGGYDEQLSALKSEENKLTNLIATLEPWRSLSIPVDMTSTQSTTILLGVIPALGDAEKLQQELLREVPESYIQVLNQDKDQSYLLVIYYTPSEDNVMQILKQYGFNRVTFKELAGTVEHNIVQAANRIKDIENKRKVLEKEMAALAPEKENLEVLYDYLTEQRDKKSILSNMVKTNKVFVLEGWVPARESQKIEKAITGQWDCILNVREPEKEEEYPVLLDNPTVVKPFELVTELYGLPDSRSIDSNIFMAPFYFVFFGLMVSDAGYGMLMALVTGIIMARYKLQGMAEKLIKLLFFGGISTFIWGVLFGGWFGNIYQILTGNLNQDLSLWFDPMSNPMKLLLWSFIFGGVHLYVGMGLQAYKLIRDGRALDALFDVGFWYVLLTGLALLFVGGTAAVIGQYMAITGAVLLVLTQGRSQKGLIRKLLSGVLSLYNVTGYLSDVLSYSRLLALGLATGVIATVVNTMGSLFGFNPLGIVILIVVFIVGHVFNILINALGAYVHASRLQYVEFFGKFFEGGGQAFQPFRIKTKYVELKDEEAI